MSEHPQLHQASIYNSIHYYHIPSSSHSFTKGGGPYIASLTWLSTSGMAYSVFHWPPKWVIKMGQVLSLLVLLYGSPTVCLHFCGNITSTCPPDYNASSIPQLEASQADLTAAKRKPSYLGSWIGRVVIILFFLGHQYIHYIYCLIRVIFFFLPWQTERLTKNIHNDRFNKFLNKNIIQIFF